MTHAWPRNRDGIDFGYDWIAFAFGFSSHFLFFFNCLEAVFCACMRRHFIDVTNEESSDRQNGTQKILSKLCPIIIIIGICVNWRKNAKRLWEKQKPIAICETRARPFPLGISNCTMVCVGPALKKMKRKRCAENFLLHIFKFISNLLLISNWRNVVSYDSCGRWN